MLALPFALLALAQAPTPPGDEPPRDPAEAVAFVRVIGDFRAEYKRIWKLPIEEREIELATGSGFVIAPSGLVLTNHHVVAGRTSVRELDGELAEISVEVKRIEVVLRPGGELRRYAAAVVASDAEEDLALLSVTGAELPYVRLGDSDAAPEGAAVQVLGYPLGRTLEVARPDSPEVVPSLSMTGGSFAARRGDESGETRLLQTSAPVQAGHSGGPMLDAEGYALGVVRLRLAKGGAGFAVPIERVKDFLERNAYLAQLPVARLRPAPLQDLPFDGVRLQPPDGFTDSSPLRLQVDSGDSLPGLRLRVDRIATPLAVSALAGLLASGALDGLEGATIAAEGGRGSLRFPGPLRMEYAVVELGEEKLIARAYGHPDAVAFNLSLARRAVDSLTAEPLLTEPVRAPLDVPLEEARLAGVSAPAVQLPQGFVVEPWPSPPCAGAPPPTAAVQVSPPGDFTVALRLFVYPASSREGREAMAACPEGPPLRGPLFGVETVLAVRWIDGAAGLLRLEAQAPLAKWSFVEGLFDRWARALAAPAR